MSNIIKFIPKPKPVSATPTQEELIESFIDEQLENFIVDCADSFEDVQEHILISDNDKFSKIAAFLRETMIATLYALQDKEHDIQDIADQLVEFNDNARVQEITVD